jgi:hypothetical protein
LSHQFSSHHRQFPSHATSLPHALDSISIVLVSVAQTAENISPKCRPFRHLRVGGPSPPCSPIIYNWQLGFYTVCYPYRSLSFRRCLCQPNCSGPAKCRPPTHFLSLPLFLGTPILAGYVVAKGPRTSLSSILASVVGASSLFTRTA